MKCKKYFLLVIKLYFAFVFIKKNMYPLNITSENIKQFFVLVFEGTL